MSGIFISKANATAAFLTLRLTGINYTIYGNEMFLPFDTFRRYRATSWLDVLGLTALWASISVYIGPSPREGERKENRKKCPNNPTRTYCKRNRPSSYHYPNWYDAPALKVNPAPSQHPTTPGLQLQFELVAPAAKSVSRKELVYKLHGLPF